MITRAFLTYAIYAIRIALPLLLLPLLTNRLGVEAFGIVLATQSLGLFGSVLTEYGFHLSGARDVSLAKSISERRVRVSRILAAQSVLAIPTTAIVLVVGWLTPGIGASPAAILSAVVIAVTNGLSPVWYFRGTGRPAIGIVSELIGQSAVVVTVTFLVLQPSDLEVALLLISTGPSVTLAILVLMTLREGNKWAGITPGNVYAEIVAAFPLFMARLASSTYTVAAVWMLSMTSSPAQVAYYGLASKFIGAFDSGIQPSIYLAMPRIMSEANISSSRTIHLGAKIASYLLFAGAGFIALVYMTSDTLVDVVFGEQMGPAADILKTMSWIVIPLVIRSVFGSLVLAAFRRDIWLSAAVIIGALAFTVVGSMLSPNYGASGMAIARITGELCILAIVIVGLAALRRRLRTN